MGSMAMFGLIDADIKSEALGKQTGMSQTLLGAFESVGRSYDAQGVFLVPRDGVITLSWDSTGKPSTGLNVKFRPYYQMALKGLNNVYAAVSLARGDRVLYFTAPVFLGATNGSEAVGAVVARTDLQKVDELLRGKADIALLLSPQGVVFASSRKEWIGHLSGTPTPDRLQAIRELKQFGNLFEKSDPPVLPMSADPGIREVDGRPHVVTSANVQWNDPMGDWSLVLMEDLTRTVPLTERLRFGLGTGIIVLLIGWGLILLLRSRYAQQQAGEQLAAYSSGQQRAAARKTQLSEAGLQMQRSRHVDELIRCFFKAAHSMFGALQGVVYLVDRAAPDRMALAGSYACADQLPAQLALGEGLLGQCAVEKRSQVIDTSSAGFAAIRSGLGETMPAVLLLAPIMLHDRFLGVVELALLHKPEIAEQEQFAEMTGLLAMNLESIGRSAGTEAQLAFQQTLLDTIPYPVFFKGADTRFLGVNTAYEEIFGVRRDDLSGKRVLDLDYLPEADRLKYQVEDEALIAAAATTHYDMKIPFADGRLHDTIYSASGFHTPDGSPGGLVGIFIDVSDIRKAERELGRMADVERFNRLAQGREIRILELKREINDLAAEAGKTPPYSTTLEESVGDHEMPLPSDYHLNSTADISTLQLSDLVDLVELQKLFTAFCESVGIAAAIIDLEGTVLVSANWQRACTGFHRLNSESCRLCIESDTELALKLQEGQDFTMYTCKNGMTDAAAPILVEGRHLANVFIGQFHLGPPDLDFFRQQAKRFGYPEADYLLAVSEAPVVDEKRLPVILGFLSGFARMIGTMSLARYRADAAQTKLQEQAELLRRERLAALSLAEDADAARHEKQQGALS
jgi:two-component system, NtrC family, C4-dicarboxylate transport sensor histidine kinase DctB